MDLILFILSKIPDQYNFLLYLAGAIFLCVIGYRLITRTLLTSKFELLFFTKSQQFKHNVLKSIIYIGAYQVFALFYALLLISANIKSFELATWALFFFLTSGSFIYLVLLITKLRIKLKRISRLRTKNKEAPHSKLQKKIMFILIIINVVSGLAFYVLFLNLLIKTNSFTPENFNSPYDYVLIFIFLIISPFLVVFCYKLLIKNFFKKNVIEKKNYQITPLEVDYFNNHDLICYYPLEKDKFILVNPEFSLLDEEFIKQFYLYDLSNNTLHKFVDYNSEKQNK